MPASACGGAWGGAFLAMLAMLAAPPMALAGGCGETTSSPTLLTDVANLEFVAIGKASTGQCFFEVHYDPVCLPKLPILSVWVDGLPLDQVESLVDPDDRSCERGQIFACPRPGVPSAASSSSFYVGDGATTALLQVDGLNAPRALVLIQPDDGVLRAGQPVVIELQPAVADLAPAGTAVRLRSDPSGTIVFSVDAAHGLTAAGTRLAFTVPSGLPRGLAGHLQIDQSLDLPVLACTIARRCRASTLSSAPAPVAVRTAP